MRERHLLVTRARTRVTSKGGVNPTDAGADLGVGARVSGGVTHGDLEADAEDDTAVQSIQS